MRGKTLVQVVNDITGHENEEWYAMHFAKHEFAQLYSWIKADVISNILEEQRIKNENTIKNLNHENRKFNQIRKRTQNGIIG